MFEDNNLVVLNKPSDFLSIEDGYQKQLPNLRGVLKFLYGEIWAVHRLDKRTSGCIIFAKNTATHRQLNILIDQRRILKNYRAIVHGFPIHNEQVIEMPLKINGDRKHRTVIDFLNGKYARTNFRVIEKLPFFSYLDLFPATGYTHQIRAHLSAVGHPVIGDKLYLRGCLLDQTNGQIEYKLETFYLHSYSIDLPQSFECKIRSFIAPVPPYFNDLISRYKKIGNC